MKTTTETNPAAAIWSAIRAHLETIQRVRFQELRSYPQPIAGCDVQFNRLAEERDAIYRELDRLDAARQNGHVAAINEFLRSSAYFDQTAEREIRTRLGEEFSRLNDLSG